MLGAPITFFGLVVVSIGSGILVGQWHFSERLEAKDGQIHRYRVALGIDEASKGALVELNNRELALKSQAIVAKLRDLTRAWDEKAKSINEQAASGKITNDQASKDKEQAMADVVQAFDQNLASDAPNVESELRKRLDPEALGQIVRVPAFVAGDSRVTLLGLMRGSSLSAFYIVGLANEMEQMAKLLPHD